MQKQLQFIWLYISSYMTVFAKKQLIFSYCWISFCLFTTAAISQNSLSKENFQFEQFTLPGGVLSNQVQDIVQDENDFLWFATKNGLFKYDGRAFKSYQADLAAKNVMYTNSIECLLFDKEGFLWIGSYGGGLMKFDCYQEEVITVLNDSTNSEYINSYVYQLLEDDQNNIWAGTSEGLFVIDKTNYTTKFFKADKNDPNALQSSIIWGLYQDKKGDIWVGTGFPWAYAPTEGGLHRYNREQNNFTHFRHLPDKPNTLTDNRIRAIAEDSRNNFWVGSMGTGLHLMDRNKGTFTSYGHLNNQELNISRPYVLNPDFPNKNFSQITFIHEDSYNRLWIGAFNGGLNIYDPSINEQLHFETQSNHSNNLTTNYLFNIFEANDQTIFLCSGDGGDNTLTKVTYSKHLFKTHPLPLSAKSNASIQTFLETNNEEIWIGTMDNGGLFIWDRDQNKIKKATIPLKSNNIHALQNDQAGNVWLGYWNDNFELVNSSNKQLLPNPVPSQDPTRAKDISVNMVFEDSKGNIWIPTRFNNVTILQPDGNIKRLTFNPKKPYDSQSIGGSSIDKIFEDEAGNIWLFGYRKTRDGLFSLVIDQYNPQTDSIQHFLKEHQERGYISGIDRDKSGNFWFTNGLDGIKKFNPKTGQITTINTTNSRIPSDEIRGLVIDNQGLIWMSTKRRVLVYHSSTETFQTFGPIDGISIELSVGATLKQKNGHLLFGGKNGFLSIDPTTIQQKTQKPPIKINQLFINDAPIHFNHSAKLDAPVWKTNHLTLDHDENSFSLGLACLDYHATNNYVEYQLEGYDNKWRTLGPEKLAVYMKVPPGNYVFKTRGSNYKGDWNPKGQSISITIQLPWWQTQWFYTLGIIGLLGLAYSIYRFQLNRQKNKQEAANLRALDALKTKLYANITHEFRTPLTLILGLAEQIKQKGTTADPSAKAQTIRENGERLLFLVNQLLDLRKLEIGQETLQLVQGNILFIFHRACNNFESLAESRNIKLLKDIPESPIIMDFDEDKLQKIIYNLLSNALKFTNNGGKIIVIVKQEKQELVISIKDDGIGIDAQQLPKIFDRFYQTNEISTNHGTGIGLALTKELIQLMKGRINVKSIVNVGSEFTVFLPITNQAPSKKETTTTNVLMPPPIPTFDALATTYSNDDQPLILVVEDNPEVAHFTASCLSPHFKVQVAQNGQIGIDKAIATIPDLIISDVMMPEKNGFQLCEALKTDERTSHIPIILLTARVDVSDRLKGLKRGADAYLAKPFLEEELVIRVKQLIKQRNALKIRYANLAEQPSSKDEVLKVEDVFVAKVRTIIENNLDNETFGVEDISQAIFLSRTQVHRKLKALTNKSTSQFIKIIRIHHAKIALQQTDKAISTIAYEVGFKDPAYFTRVFTEVEGISPTKFKALHNEK